MKIVLTIMHWPYCDQSNWKVNWYLFVESYVLLSGWTFPLHDFLKIVNLCRRIYYLHVHFYSFCMRTVHCKLGIYINWVRLQPVWRCCGVCVVSLELCLGCWEQSGWLMNDLSEVMRSGVLDASWLPPPYSTDSLPRLHHLSPLDWLEKSVSPLSQRCTNILRLTYFELYVERW